MIVLHRWWLCGVEDVSDNIGFVLTFRDNMAWGRRGGLRTSCWLSNIRRDQCEETHHVQDFQSLNQITTGLHKLFHICIILSFFNNHTLVMTENSNYMKILLVVDPNQWQITILTGVVHISCFQYSYDIFCKMNESTAFVTLLCVHKDHQLMNTDIFPKRYAVGDMQ